MQNSIAHEFSWASQFIEHIVELFPWLTLLLFPHLVPNLLRDCQMMDQYLSVLTFLLVNFQVLLGVLMTRIVAPLQEGFVLPVLVSSLIDVHVN